MLIEGIAGRFVAGLRGMYQIGMTGLGSLRVAQLEGEGDEATRAGLRFIASATGATGIAPVQAIPTTAAQWMLWNPSNNNVAAFIDDIDLAVVSGTAGAGGSFYGILVPPKFAPTTIATISSANVQIMNANPLTGKGSNLILVASQTLVNAAVGNWVPMGQMNPNGTVLAQTVLYGDKAHIRGRLVIPAGCGLGLAVLSPTGTTPLYAPIIRWREYQADLE